MVSDTTTNTQMPRPLTELSDDALEATSRVTLEHYHRGAASFWEGTRDHDVKQQPWLATVWRKS